MNAVKNEERHTRRMYRWRNVLCPESEPDAEILRIDAVEDTLPDLPGMVDRIRALISRVDPLSHYKAFDNVDFLLDAIGQLDYPRSPAVDVLWRHGQIDDQRRAEAKCYIDALSAWISGVPLDKVKSQQTGNNAILDKVYTALGETDDYKRWLAMTLRKTLKEHTYTSWDFIAECDDTTFVLAVYEGILHRQPSPDDLKFRLEELANGKDRKDFFQEIFDAGEHQNSHMSAIAEKVKRTV